MRLSVTELDGFRYWKSAEDMDLDAFLARMRKQEPPSPKMLAGRALHSILEDAQVGEVAVAERDGFSFTFEADCSLQMLPVREMKGEIGLHTSSGLVTLVGIVDGLDGGIYDHKLTERFDAENYANSYQWRCYLTMFGAQRFTYNVFEGREKDINTWVIYGFHPLTFYAYPGMADDVQREVNELAAFVAKHLPERV